MRRVVCNQIHPRRVMAAPVGGHIHIRYHIIELLRQHFAAVQERGVLIEERRPIMRISRRGFLVGYKTQRKLRLVLFEPHELAQQAILLDIAPYSAALLANCRHGLVRRSILEPTIDTQLPKCPSMKITPPFWAAQRSTWSTLTDVKCSSISASEARYDQITSAKISTRVLLCRMQNLLMPRMPHHRKFRA